MLILVGFNTSFVKKKSKFFPKKRKFTNKRVSKKYNAVFLDEKSQSRFPNVHLVRIHSRNQGRWNPPPPRSPRRFQTLVGIGLIYYL